MEDISYPIKRIQLQLSEKANQSDFSYVYPEQSQYFSTDIAQGINDMANYAVSNGYILRFRRGKEYVINQYINIPVNLVVDLNGATITRNYDKTQYPTIRLGGNNVIYGGTINGNQSNIPDASTNFINYADIWTRGDNIKIHDIYIHDSTGECIRVDSNNVDIYNCTFGRALDHQIYMKPSNVGTESFANIHIWDNKFIDNVTTRELLKVADGFDNVLIEGNYFEVAIGWLITCDNSPNGGNNGTIRVKNNTGKCLYFSEVSNSTSNGLMTSEIVFEKNRATILGAGKILKCPFDSTSDTRNGFYVGILKYIENSFSCSDSSVYIPIIIDSISANLIEFEGNTIDYRVSGSTTLIKMIGVVGIFRFRNNLILSPTKTYSEYSNVFMQLVFPATGVVGGANCKTILFKKNIFLNTVSPLLNDLASNTVSAFLWDMLFYNNNFLDAGGNVRLVNISSTATNSKTITKKVIASKNYNRGGDIKSAGIYNTSMIATDVLPL
ncbi:hypothetical protein B9W14_18375 [Clostridium drakei]|uniref:Uncharacterized protein n=2 Tax=Clostridium drakei TaxID=332101 RepID=A0A2U8DUS4_9CLOT|nr:hypothetical protein B9W14_18375 [Clostridium drakei]